MLQNYFDVRSFVPILAFSWTSLGSLLFITSVFQFDRSRPYFTWRVLICGEMPILHIQEQAARSRSADSRGLALNHLSAKPNTMALGQKSPALGSTENVVESGSLSSASDAGIEEGSNFFHKRSAFSFSDGSLEPVSTI